MEVVREKDMAARDRTTRNNHTLNAAAMADWKRILLAVIIGVGVHRVALPDPATVWSPWVTRVSLSLFAWLGLWLVPTVGLMFWVRTLAPDANVGRDLGHLGITLAVIAYPVVHVFIWGFTVFDVVIIQPKVAASNYVSLVSRLGLIAFSFLGVVFIELITWILTTEYLSV